MRQYLSSLNQCDNFVPDSLRLSPSRGSSPQGLRRLPLARLALGTGDGLWVGAFATDIGVSPFWAFCQDVSGRYVGSVLGWTNMWGNFVLAGITALGMDASKPLIPREPEEK
jgi:hypothetical protein